ncbi:hypothetical protein CASFOL_035445 [Castilleja foliolosa]|uniref:Uncharacterized protein n=1 Tax=Castilleja foliolosa TaxID=1961234 RepID=A0ABD3BSM2_9LAMI
MDNRKRKIVSDHTNMLADLYREWDEISCPICMEHPHNAVLLICSSHEKGCRSYICDTSYRHSNCLDRFKKLKEENPDTTSSPPNLNPGGPRVPIDSPSLENNSNNNNNNNIEKMVGGLNFKCPLCRGTVSGLKVIEEARKYLNSKLRSCSRESCSFSGNYQEIRGHARRVHPKVRPADIDPLRERAWRRLEDQREYNDVVSAVPGSFVVGDYAIERGSDEETRDDESGQDLSRVILLHMMHSMDGRGSGTRTRPVTRMPQPRVEGSRVFVRYRSYPTALTGNIGGPIPRRRYLWGENLLGLQDDRSNDDEDEDEDDDDGEDEDDEDDNDADDNQAEENEVNTNMLNDPLGRRLRRRITRTRSGNQWVERNLE